MKIKTKNLRQFIKEAIEVKYWTKDDDKLLEA
jgi:hypothetical protein